jgi:hypothetical protein
MSTAKMKKGDKTLNFKVKVILFSVEVLRILLISEEQMQMEVSFQGSSLKTLLIITSFM